MTLRILLVVLSVFAFINAYCQTHDIHDSIQLQWEDNINTGEEYSPTENEVSVDEHILPERIDLNHADSLTLFKTGLFSSQEIHSFIAIRNENGKIGNLILFQGILGWDDKRLNQLSQIATTEDNLSGNISERIGFRRGVHRIQYELSWRNQYLQGSDDTTANITDLYLGSPFVEAIRYRYVQKNAWQYALTARKDAGERFWNQKTDMPDFLSWHVQFIRNGFMKKVIIGDYQVNMGQGLLMWESTSLGKNADAIAVKKQGSVFTPYLGAGVSHFEKGIACSMGYRRYGLHLFFSGKRYDAALHETDSLMLHVEAIQTSGLHRTNSEIDKMAALSKQSFGASFSFNNNNTHLSINMVRDYFSHPWMKGSLWYQKNDPEGSNFLHGSFDYSITINNAHFFGEEALNSQSYSALNGLLLSVSRQFDLAVLHRQYSSDGYDAFFDNAIRQGSRQANESALYLGLTYKPNPQMTLQAYFDNFSHPWFRYGCPGSTNGRDIMINAKFQFNKENIINIRVKHLIENVLSVENNNRILPVNLIKTQATIQAEIRSGLACSIKSRLDLKCIKMGDNIARFGFLVFTDLRFKAASEKLGIQWRNYMFNTDSYDSRIVVFENSIAASSTVTSFYGSGIGEMFIINWIPRDKVNISVKYSIVINKLKDGYTSDFSVAGHTSIKNQIQTSVTCFF